MNDEPNDVDPTHDLRAHEARRIIEAVVLSSIEPVEPGLLAQLVELPVAHIHELCSELADDYERTGRGFVLTRVAGGYRFQTHPELAPYVERFVLEGQHARLSAPTLETLAIVAYKQPISRGRIAAIRGVDPESVLGTLLARGYIEEVGRDPGPGNAVMFGTSRSFLERLGLDSLADLPPLGDFVPAPDVVDALERGLRISDDPAPADAARARATKPVPEDDSGHGSEPHVAHRESSRSGERLQKVLARAGFGSRRAAEELIAAGRVAVDGEVASLGRRVDPERERITVDGIPVVVHADVVYYLLNKPARVVTTARDPEGRPTVIDLVPLEPRVFPVGRLDYETEGLLVLTNDGELAQLLSHPSHAVEKAYLAEVEGVPSRAALRRLREGVDLDDGRTAPARARIVQTHGDSAALEVVIHEGRNRQVRRMCEEVGHPVRRLVRTRIGPVSDRRLAPGKWRPLRRREVRALFEAAGAPENTSGDEAGGN